MLTAIAATRNGAATPAQLIAASPELQARDIRSATASLHLTANRLVQAGYLKRGREQARSQTTGRVQGGRRLYRITAAGREALR